LPFTLGSSDDSDVRLSCFVPLGLSLFFGIPCGLLALNAASMRRRNLAARRQGVQAQDANPFAPAVGKPPSDLGAEVSYHPPTGLHMQPIVLAVAAFGLLGLATVFGGAIVMGAKKAQSHKPVPLEVWAVPAVLGFLAVCCLLGSVASVVPRPAVRLFTGGIQLESGEGTVSFRWDEVVEYRAPRSTFTGTWRFELSDGRVFMFFAGIRNVLGFINGFVSEHGVPALVEGRLREIRSGGVVRVGDFQLSRSAVWLGGREVPWDQLTRAVIHIYPRRGQKYLRVDVAGRMFTWQSGNLWTMKSEAVLLALLERLAPPRIWG
jgi:hypothetical protein